VHFVAARRTLIATICLISVSLNTAVVHSHYCFERCKKYNNVIDRVLVTPWTTTFIFGCTVLSI